MRIDLTPDLTQFVEGRVRSGGYADASAVVRDALNLLRITPRTFGELQQMIDVGRQEAERGETAPLDIDAIRAEGRAALGLDP